MKKTLRAEVIVTEYNNMTSVYVKNVKFNITIKPSANPGLLMVSVNNPVDYAYFTYNTLFDHFEIIKFL